MSIHPQNHADCAAFLKQSMADLGIEMTVSTLPPIVESPYEDLGLTCPHGVRFYGEPTSEQIAQWAADGVA